MSRPKPVARIGWASEHDRELEKLHAAVESLRGEVAQLRADMGVRHHRPPGLKPQSHSWMYLRVLADVYRGAWATPQMVHREARDRFPEYAGVKAGGSFSILLSWGYVERDGKHSAYRITTAGASALDRLEPSA